MNIVNENKFKQAVITGNLKEVLLCEKCTCSENQCQGIRYAILNEKKLSWKEDDSWHTYQTYPTFSPCGQKRLIDYFISRCHKCLNVGLETAIEIANVFLIDYLILCGAYPKVGLKRALECQSPQLVQYMLNKGTSWNALLLDYIRHLDSKNLHWIREVIRHGATNLNEAFEVVMNIPSELNYIQHWNPGQYYRDAIPFIQLLVACGAKNEKPNDPSKRSMLNYTFAQSILDYNTSRIQFIQTYIRVNLHGIPIDVVNHILLSYIPWDMPSDVFK